MESNNQIIKALNIVCNVKLNERLKQQEKEIRELEKELEINI